MAESREVDFSGHQDCNDSIATLVANRILRHYHPAVVFLCPGHTFASSVLEMSKQAGSPNVKGNHKSPSALASGLKRFIAPWHRKSPSNEDLGVVAATPDDDSIRLGTHVNISLPRTLANVEASIAHLLTSNDVPADSEVGVVMDLLTEVAKTNAMLEKKRVKSSASRLAKDQNNMLARALGGVLSPVRRLPPEMICLIISFTVMEDSYSPFEIWNSDRTVRYKKSTWSVSRISRLWRACALAVPDLWRQFPSVHLSDNHSVTCRQITMFEELIRRSHSYIDISIDCGDGSQPVTDHPIIQLLWFRALKGNLPLLSTLKVAFSDSCNHLRLPQNHGPRPIDTFLDAPVLRHVHLGGPCVKVLQLPAKSLTHIITTSLPVFSGSVYDSLTTLTLIGTGNSWDTQMTVQFPLLRTLHFDATGHGMLLFLSQSMCCPVLEEITGRARIGNILAVLDMLLMKSHLPPISMMSIRANLSEHGSGWLRPLLEKVLTLTQLDITLPPTADLRDLALPLQSPHRLVPCLVSCSFSTTHSMSREEGNAIVYLAETRCELSDDTGAKSVMALTIEAPDYTIVSLRKLQQAIVEPWYRDLSDTLLAQLASHLAAVMPWGIGMGGVIRHETSYVKRIRDVLKTIEKYEPADCQEIMMSGLHTMLVKLMHLSYNFTIKESNGKKF
ncbi:hypothetical protein D9619_011722 [Psilocybe cf. subviscida]|uniref:F-box domain-containing protein n=1 Tax=Psilocybe cf. subviscida TaxID=2480587 RepID=A0A8H5BSQ5_9AGAR|nr:hypothetical protein D9619_011722 [Psilocybe cf. subviscida]